MSETNEKGLMAFMNRRMMACDEAGYQVSKSFEARLPFFKRIGLKIHLFTCKVCRNYAKQLKQLNRLVVDYREQSECSCQHHMKSESKDDLHSKICCELDAEK